MPSSRRRIGHRHAPTCATGLVAGCLLCACATSSTTLRSEPLAAEKAAPPPSGQARIVAVNKSSYFTPERQSFVCLDGEDIRGWFTSKKELVLAPGRHYLTLVVNFDNHFGSELMWFDAAANHVYEVRYRARVDSQLVGDPGTSEFLSVLFDRATNRPVGGITGGEPPVAHDPPKCSYLRQIGFGNGYTAPDKGRPPALEPLRVRGNAILVGLEPRAYRLSGVDEFLTVTAVDGQKTGGGLARLFSAGVLQAEVAPGRHRIAIQRYVDGLAPYEKGVIDVDVQAGGVYDIKRVVKGYDVGFAAVRRR